MWSRKQYMNITNKYYPTYHKRMIREHLKAKYNRCACCDQWCETQEHLELECQHQEVVNSRNSWEQRFFKKLTEKGVKLTTNEKIDLKRIIDTKGGVIVNNKLNLNFSAIKNGIIQKTFIKSLESNIKLEVAKRNKIL